MIRVNLTRMRLAGIALTVVAPLTAMAVGPDVLLPATRPATQPATQPAGALPATRPITGAATKPAAAAQPRKVSDTFLQGQRNQRDNMRNSIMAQRDAGEVKLSELIQFSLEGGWLKADILASPVQNETVRYKVKGSKAIFTTSRSSYTTTQWNNNVLVRSTVSNANLQRFDPDSKEDADIWSVHLQSNPNLVSIRGQSVLGYIYFSQSHSARAIGMGGVAGPSVSLMVQEWAPMPNGNGIRMNTAFRGTARSVSELRAKQPEAFRKYLVPMLAKLSDLSFLAPGASDVYSVFSELPADPQATAMVDALLPDLDSDAFAVRDAASTRLLELGPPAVHAVLRKDLSQLSDEQRAQIGRLIAAHRRRGDLSPAEARQDTTFLTDCLEHPDAAVRAAAKASLEKLLGESLTFDPKATGEQLGESADAVRKKIVDAQTAAAATTQPAAQPDNNNNNGGAQILPAPARLNVGQILVK